MQQFFCRGILRFFPLPVVVCKSFEDRTDAHMVMFQFCFGAQKPCHVQSDTQIGKDVCRGDEAGIFRSAGFGRQSQTRSQQTDAVDHFDGHSDSGGGFDSFAELRDVIPDGMDESLDE